MIQFHSTYTNASSYYLHIVDFHKSPFQNTRHQPYTEQTLQVKSIMIPKIILHMYLTYRIILQSSNTIPCLQI